MSLSELLQRIALELLRAASRERVIALEVLHRHEERVRWYVYMCDADPENGKFE